MKPILIFRHTYTEGPGYFSQFLEQHHIPYLTICLDRGDTVPTELENISALVFMGGPMSVNDPLPWIEPELNLIRKAIAKNMPVLGHCLGGQLISKALGGVVTANPVKEFGWHDVEQIDCDAGKQWLAQLPYSFPAFHWHGETFSIPDGATNILRSAHCSNQGFVVGNTLAMQCHIEMTEKMIRKWAHLHSDDIATATDSIQTYEQMCAEMDEKLEQLQQHASLIYKRWLAPIKTL